MFTLVSHDTSLMVVIQVGFFVQEILNLVYDVVDKMAGEVADGAARCPWSRRAARHIVFATCCLCSPRAVSPCFVQAFLLLIRTSDDERVSKIHVTMHRLNGEAFGVD